MEAHEADRIGFKVVDGELRIPIGGGNVENALPSQEGSNGGSEPIEENRPVVEQSGQVDDGSRGQTPSKSLPRPQKEACWPQNP